MPRMLLFFAFHFHFHFNSSLFCLKLFKHFIKLHERQCSVITWDPTLSLVFICRENPRRSGILLFPDRPRLSRLMETGNRRHPRSSGMVADKLGVFLFSQRAPDFCDGRRSFPTYENSNLYCRGRRQQF